MSERTSPRRVELHSRRDRGPMRLVRLVAGIGLVVIGLAGLVLPVMPGWLFIVPGLSLLSTEFRWAAALRRKASRQLDRVRRRTDSPQADESTEKSRRIA